MTDEKTTGIESNDKPNKKEQGPSVESLMLRFMHMQLKSSASPLRDDVEAAMKRRGLL